MRENMKVWWEEHKEKVYLGTKCLVIGLGIGFIKGMLCQSKYNGECMSKLIDNQGKVTDDDIDDYISKNLPDKNFRDRMRFACNVYDETEELNKKD